jgi:hypothetical protein
MSKPNKKATPTPISAYTPQLGHQGPQITSARTEPLTDKQRREIAMRAAKARWQKRSARS